MADPNAALADLKASEKYHAGSRHKPDNNHDHDSDADSEHE